MKCPGDIHQFASRLRVVNCERRPFISLIPFSNIFVVWVLRWARSAKNRDKTDIQNLAAFQLIFLTLQIYIYTISSVWLLWNMKNCKLFKSGSPENSNTGCMRAISLRSSCFLSFYRTNARKEPGGRRSAPGVSKRLGRSGKKASKKGEEVGRKEIFAHLTAHPTPYFRTHSKFRSLRVLF